MRPDANVNQLSDQMIAADCLDSLKFLGMAYNVATIEAASPDVRDMFMDIHRDEIHGQGRFFSLMNNRGWYQLDYAPAQKISQIQNQWQEPNAPNWRGGPGTQFGIGTTGYQATTPGGPGGPGGTTIRPNIS